MHKHRIKLLDSFRCIAIISVLLYHFASPWVISYPYGTYLFAPFSYGYLGVRFFFIISGFVICYTLEHTPDLFSFYRNRMLRLFPPMLLCSVITFLTVPLIDDQNVYGNAHQLKNFLPSLTFINPRLWALITHTDFHWLSGSHWSLWPEVQFYVISSGLYFLSKRNFFKNMLITGMFIACIKYIPVYFLKYCPAFLESHGLHAIFTGWRYADELFYVTFYITWFLIGVIFYQLYTGLKGNRWFLSASAVLILICMGMDTWFFFKAEFYPVLFGAVLMFALFLAMIYRRHYLFFLENAYLYRIGIISYTMYLIHEDIGILLIRKYGKYLGNWNVLAPFIMGIAVICFAGLSYRLYERKVVLILKK